jgi:hypothetical protein
VSIWSSLDPGSATVDPGGAATVTLRLRNTTDLVEEYRIAVAGQPGVWAEVEPRTLRLYPGTTGTAEITFRPPRTPDATAGGHPFAVEVTPTEQPGDKAVVEGHLTVTPFSEVRAELLPHTVRGRFRGKPQFAVDNFGNTRLTASLTGQDIGGRLGFELRPANVQVEPGRAAWVQGRVKPPAITWFGRRESHPYTVNVLRSGAESVKVEGVFVQQAIMPHWLLGFMSLLLACTIAFTIAWFTFQPKFGSRAREGKMATLGQPLSLPSEQAPPTGKPSQSAKPEPKPQNAAPRRTSRLPQGANFSSVTRVLLRNVMTGMCADIEGLDRGAEGWLVHQFTCDKSPTNNQLWDLVVQQKGAGPGGANLFTVRNSKDGLCMDLPGQDPVTVGDVTEGRCAREDRNQLWYLEKKARNRFWIRNHVSQGLCLDVSELNGTGGPKAKLTVFPCHIKDDHLWAFY